MTDDVSMSELLEFRRKFDACLAEIGQPPASACSLDGDNQLRVIAPNPTDLEWMMAAVQALRLTAPTFPPAAQLLQSTEHVMYALTQATEAQLKQATDAIRLA